MARPEAPTPSTAKVAPVNTLRPPAGIQGIAYVTSHQSILVRYHRFLLGTSALSFNRCAVANLSTPTTHCRLTGQPRKS